MFINLNTRFPFPPLTQPSGEQTCHTRSIMLQTNINCRTCFTYTPPHLITPNLNNRSHGHCIPTFSSHYHKSFMFSACFSFPFGTASVCRCSVERNNCDMTMGQTKSHDNEQQSGHSIN